MAQNVDLRKQTSAPTTPSDSDKIVVYANESGRLVWKDSAGVVRSVAGTFEQAIEMAGGAISANSYTAGMGPASIPSGSYYGNSGVAGSGNVFFMGVGINNDWELFICIHQDFFAAAIFKFSSK